MTRPMLFAAVCMLISLLGICFILGIKVHGMQLDRAIEKCREVNMVLCEFDDYTLVVPYSMQMPVEQLR